MDGFLDSKHYCTMILLYSSSCMVKYVLVVSRVSVEGLMGITHGICAATISAGVGKLRGSLEDGGGGCMHGGYI